MKIPNIKVPWWTRGTVLAYLLAAILTTLFLLILAYSRETVSVAEKIDFSVKTILGSAAAISLLVAYQSFRLNIYKDQVRGSFEFISRYDSATDRAARNTLERIIERTGTLHEYLHDIIPELRVAGFMKAANEEERDAIRLVVCYFEDVSLAIRTGYAHEAILYRSLGPSALRYINAARPFIMHVCKQSNNSLYYADAILLLLRWRSNESLRT